MMKEKRSMKRTISFLMMLCLLAGNTVLTQGEPAKVTVSEWTQVSETMTGDMPMMAQSFSLACVLGGETLNHLPESNIRTAQAAAGERYVFIQPDSSTNNIVESNSTVNLTTATTTLFVSKVDSTNTPIEFNSNVSVDIYSANTSVVSVDPYDPSDPTQSKFARTLRREGPGYAQVTAVISDPDAGSSTIITCLIHVELRVVRDDTQHWKAVDLDGDHRVLVLNQKNEKEYQLSLKYVDDEKIEDANLTWKFSKDGVISVDGAGKLTVLGAGHTTVTITTDTNNGQSKADVTTFEVVVTPIGSENVQAPNPPADPSAYTSFEQEVNLKVDAPYFTIYSNGNPATNMIWEVFSVDANGNEKRITQTDTKLLTYAISEDSGNLSFTDVKAGTYVIRGYATKDYDAAWAVVTYNVIVNLSMKDTTIFMNVGDTYSILNNSNVPEALFQYLFTFTYANDDHEFIAGIDRRTGLITALNRGTAEIIMTYNKSSNSGIFDKDDATSDNLNKQVKYTVKVIDGIALNTTSMSMYTGATYQLTANATDRTVPIVWKSSDPSFATVDSTGLVTAIKATGATRPIQIYASQTIDGVEKSAVCNIYIQAAVTQVTLNPSVTTLEIGEYETIKATVSPSGISGTVLTWLSSDTSVFEIVDHTDLSATIQGKAGGVAVLTAINGENVIVGYCKVTVNQQAEGIKISETSVKAKLSSKTYQLYATITPDNTTNTKLTWSTTDGKVATVDQNGKVTFKSSGKVTIVVQSQDNPALIAYCNFEILKAVTGVELDTKSLELYVGQTQRLTYLVFPSNASNLDVEWTSFNPAIVAVDDTGMLTAKGVGTTQVMIMTYDGAYYAICTVVVKQKAVSVKVNYTDVTMNAGEYFDMEVTVAPATSTEKSLTWQSLNTKVATVSSTGRITARAAGTAVIVVKTESGVSSYCTVTVLEPVISMELDTDEITIDVGDTFTLEPIFKPANATNTDVTWASSDDSIAEVNAIGEVTGISGGTVVIVCETVDGGMRSYCLVRVEEPVIDIKLSPETYCLGINKSYTLTATITNHGTATDVGIIWSSSDEDICTVDERGKITGIDYGTAVITAEAADGYGAYATCEVEVVKEVTSVKLNYSVVTLVQGETFALDATILPYDATYDTAVYSSSDDTIAMVDDDGIVTGLEPGKVLIRADAGDNSGKYAICHVTVIEPVASTGVTVSDKEIVMLPGEKKQITISIKPLASTDTVTWSSNNEAIASVNPSGTITAHQTGTATVTVMTSSGKTATINVIVLGLSRTKLEMPVYTKYSRLYVDGATSTIRWDVEDTSICEVNNGIIIARKPGKTYVTATINGRSLRCEVIVTTNKRK